MDRDHVWYMQQLQAITAEGGPSLMTTNYRVVDLANEVSV